MKILITGITGFVGSHLVDFLLKEVPNCEIYGLCRWRSPLDNIKHVLDKVHLIHGDLTDYISIEKMIRDVRPDYVFHLASQSLVPYSFTAPIATLDTNCQGTCNLLEAVKNTRSDNFDPIIAAITSSEVYGQVKEEEIPINENCPFRPASPYAVSKVCQDMLAYQYYVSWGIKTIRARMFSHTSPRRADVFVASNFAKQIALIEKNKQSPIIKVGNLDSVRTFADARDTVKAYWMLVNQCDIGEVYNIGGVETMTIGKMLNMLISLSNFSGEYIIQTDPARLRPSDVTLQIPDCTKFISKTGWKPEIPFIQTLEDLLNYWREKV